MRIKRKFLPDGDGKMQYSVPDLSKIDYNKHDFEDLSDLDGINEFERHTEIYLVYNSSILLDPCFSFHSFWSKENLAVFCSKEDNHYKTKSKKSKKSDFKTKRPLSYSVEKRKCKEIMKTSQHMMGKGTNLSNLNKTICEASLKFMGKKTQRKCKTNEDDKNQSDIKNEKRNSNPSFSSELIDPKKDLSVDNPIKFQKKSTLITKDKEFSNFKSKSQRCKSSVNGVSANSLKIVCQASKKLSESKEDKNRSKEGKRSFPPEVVTHLKNWLKLNEKATAETVESLKKLTGLSKTQIKNWMYYHKNKLVEKNA